MAYAHASHARACLRFGRSSALVYEKPQSVCGLYAVFLRHIFAVAYSRNVICHKI
jgi:hypothetical protein